MEKRVNLSIGRLEKVVKIFSYSLCCALSDTSYQTLYNCYEPIWNIRQREKI